MSSRQGSPFIISLYIIVNNQNENIEGLLGSISCLLCRRSARVRAGWSKKCWRGRSWSSSPLWPLCNTFVQSGNVDSMDYGIAVGFVLFLRVPTEIKALLWLVLHTHRKRRSPSQSLQSNRQDRWKTGSRRGTQKWSDLPEVTQQVSDRAKNKKPCYFLPAWCPLPKAMCRISLRLKCSESSAGPLPAAECSCAVERWLWLSARELCARQCSVSLCGCPGTVSTLIWKPYCNTEG